MHLDLEVKSDSKGQIWKEQNKVPLSIKGNVQEVGLIIRSMYMALLSKILITLEFRRITFTLKVHLSWILISNLGQKKFTSYHITWILSNWRHSKAQIIFKRPLELSPNLNWTRPLKTLNSGLWRSQDCFGFTLLHVFKHKQMKAHSIFDIKIY